jgi:hypothetical protein
VGTQFQKYTDMRCEEGGRERNKKMNTYKGGLLDMQAEHSKRKPKERRGRDLPGI